MIIGISGKMGTGKTTLADHLAKQLDGHRASFADALRLEVGDYFGVPLEAMTNRYAKELTLVPVGYQYKSIRALLQWWGSLRREADKDYWANKLISSIGWDEVVIIDDVRYQNEADAILRAGGSLVRLQPYPGWVSGEGGDHLSETDLDYYEYFDHVFKPEFGSLFHLAFKIKKMY